MQVDILLSVLIGVLTACGGLWCLWPRRWSLCFRRCFPQVNKSGLKDNMSESFDSSKIQGKIDLPTRREDSLLMQPLGA